MEVNITMDRSGFFYAKKGEVLLLLSRLMEGAGGVRHAFTTRIGGCSTGIYSSMNLSRNTNTSRESTLENYRLLGEAVGFDDRDFVISRQVHGNTVRVVRESDGGDAFAPVPFDCDALVTAVPGKALVIYTADCVPVLLYNKAAGCIAAVHAGWRGIANGVILKALEVMASEYGSDAGDVVAAVGPCIEQDCFEVDADVRDALCDVFGKDTGLIERRGEKFFPDLRGFARLWLLNAGVPDKSIAVCEECTKCEGDKYWSHRRDGNARGLQGAVIVLDK